MMSTPDKASSQPKPQYNHTVPQPPARTNQPNVETMNRPNPYFQSPHPPKIDQSSNNNNTHMAIDLLQAQTQFGPAGAAAVAVAAHRNVVGTVSYGAAS